MKSFYIGLRTDPNENGYALFVGCDIDTLKVDPFLLNMSDAEDFDWGSIVDLSPAPAEQPTECDGHIFEVRTLEAVHDSKPFKKEALRYQICINHFLEEMGWATNQVVSVQEAADSMAKTFSVFPDGP